jgi:hypothetical protein
MPADQTMRGFAKLTNDQQARVLCRLGSRLTTLSGAFVSAQKKRGVNEICHRIFGQLGHIISDSTQRYPDSVFVELMNAIARENHLAEEFSDALMFALSTHGTNILHIGSKTSQPREKRPAKVPSERRHMTSAE